MHGSDVISRSYFIKEVENGHPGSHFLFLKYNTINNTIIFVHRLGKRKVSFSRQTSNPASGKDEESMLLLATVNQSDVAILYTAYSVFI